MHKKSFSRATASLITATLLVAPSVYADQSAIGFDNLTAAKAAADFCDSKVTSEAMVTASLSRAQTHAELNAFITLDENGALVAAKQADAARKSGARCSWRSKRLRHYKDCGWLFIWNCRCGLRVNCPCLARHGYRWLSACSFCIEWLFATTTHRWSVLTSWLDFMSEWGNVSTNGVRVSR
jgi:hypothetical protein